MGIVDLLHIITILTCRLQHYQHTLHSTPSKLCARWGMLVLFPLSPFCLGCAPLSICSEFFPRIKSKQWHQHFQTRSRCLQPSGIHFLFFIKGTQGKVLPHEHPGFVQHLPIPHNKSVSQTHTRSHPHQVLSQISSTEDIKK